MSTHTEGPWLLDEDGQIIAGDKHIATVHPTQFRGEDVFDWDTAMANGVLIIAAPDLLKACRQAIVMLKGREHDGFLRDAIAKATGDM